MATQSKKTPAHGTTRKSNYAEKDRQAMLAKINIAKKQVMNNDDDTYRAMLQNVIGTSSCKEATLTQLQAVIDYMVQHGATLTNRKSHGKRPHNIASTAPQSCAELLQKIEAQLTDAGRPWDYITAKGDKPQSMLKRITGKETLAFCDAKELQKLIAALDYDKKRREKAVKNG